MYGWIWRHLPGPLAVRLVQALTLVAVAVTALFLWVFPRVEAALPYSDVTVPGPTTSHSPQPGTPAAGTPTPAPVPGTPAPSGPATLPAD